MNTKIVEYFKVLSDPNRLEIIELLLKGESCGCILIDNLTISQPTLSYHLKFIKEAGLARCSREGNLIKYLVNKDKLNDIIKFLEKLRDTQADECQL